MNARLGNLLFPFVLLFLLIAMTAGQGMAEEPFRIVILPYEINAERDLSFISEGIVDMLSSRLAWEDRVVVVPEEETKDAIKDLSVPLSEESARNLGTRLQASHVLFGSVTVFGKSVSLDSKVVDVYQAKPTLTFSSQAAGMDDLIPKVDFLADEINEKVFGRQPEGVQQAAQAPESPSIYAHPETLLGPGAAGAQRTAPTGAAATGGFAAVGGIPPTGMTVERFWKSQSYKTVIKGMALGDVDGDGRTELVFISEDHIYVHRFENQRLLKIWAKEGKMRHRFLGVDIADVNGNGRAEIFVTAVEGSMQRLGSFVLEWNGDDFKEVTKDEPWYYRVIDTPDQGPVLLGQKRKIDELFVPGVYQLVWRNGEYEPEERITLPKRINVFGFTLGDVFNNGRQSIVAYDENDYIRIFDTSCEEQWTSNERYGGSTNYLEFPMHGNADDMMDRLYLPQRILIRDLDNDGKNEVVVAANEGALRRLLARFRHFSNGYVALLSWDNLGLTLSWHTPKVSGYISDHAIGDLDNDGKDEVVVAQVGRKGRIITSARSSIIAYKPPQASPSVK